MERTRRLVAPHNEQQKPGGSPGTKEKQAAKTNCQAHTHTHTHQTQPDLEPSLGGLSVDATP